LLLFASLLFARPLQSFFHFASPWPFAILALGVVGDVPFTFRAAYVCGQHGFGRASYTNVLSAVAKIVCSVVLVLAGFGTIGAMWGVTASQFIACVYIAYWAKRLGLRRAADSQLFSKLQLKPLVPELRYTGFVLICSLLITLQFSIDIIVVKHFFDAHTAGLYAGIATVARIIFFVTAAFAQVLMPSVKIKNSRKQNLALLVKSFYLLGAIGLPALACFVLFPQFIMRMLMGGQYVLYANLLPLLSVSVFVVSTANLVVAYYMALRRYVVAMAVVLGAFATYVLMAMNHQTPHAVVESLFYGSLTMVVLIGAVALLTTKAVVKDLQYETH
jgi:O-antigen/teichoic acid export membrane protein